jgi:hypothetical protein
LRVFYVKVKGNVYPVTYHEGPEGELRYSFTLSLTSALDLGGGVVPAALTLGERPGTHCTGGWEDLRTGLGLVLEISSPPRFDLRAVQPVRSRYIGEHCRPTLMTGTYPPGSHLWKEDLCM